VVHGFVVFPTRCAPAISLRPPALPSILAASFEGADPSPSNPALPLRFLPSSRIPSTPWIPHPRIPPADPPPADQAAAGSMQSSNQAAAASFDGALPSTASPQWLPQILPVDPSPSNQAAAASFHPRIEQPRLPSMALLPSTASPAAAPLESRSCATSHPDRPPTMEGVMPVLVIRRGAVRT
jgi:hypothetical protein